MIDLSTYRGQTIAVMGLGASGLVAARALQRGGAIVRAWDDQESSRTAAADDGIPISDLAGDSWDGIDALVLSPGIPHTYPTPHPVAARAKEHGCAIIGDIELLAKAQPAARYVGITGTNGKSTTTALIGHILNHAGRTIDIGGNLGMPALDLAPMDEDGIYVLEMSSYQLELTSPIPFDIAVMLNVTADHLDRHGGMNGYVAAKKRIFDGQGARHAAVVGIDDEICQSIADALRDDETRRVIPISGDHRVSLGVYAIDRFLYDDMDGDNVPVLSLDEVPTMPGTHNAQNASAAYAVARVLDVDPSVIVEAIRSYPGLAHRQQLAAEIDGIRYVNDSKATNAEAAARALSSYEHIYWIAGGLAKEGGLDAAAPYFPRIRHAFLIGEASDDFARSLVGQVAATQCGVLETAIHAAHAMAQRDGNPDAVVLLSPACASFDQFPNFEERGNSFCRTVAALPGSSRTIRNDGGAT